MWLKIKISQWNKNGVYIMRLKKITWLQACFLGNMKVIWCNSLGDSHFQTYVMNNVEIVIDYYLRITSHVSHAVTSCTHYTSYSLLNLVHEIQNYMFFDFDTKYIHWLNFGDKMCHNLVLKFWVENSCFWKFMESFSCIICHEKSFKNWFCRKISSFFKKFSFPKFRLIESDFRSIENFQIFQVRPLPNSVGIRSMLDQSKLKNFQFLSIWPIYFFSCIIYV